MATESPEIPKSIDSFLTKLDHHKTLLINYTDLYKTLTSHFTILQNTLDSKLQTLDSQFQTLHSTFTQSLDSLKTREDSLPELLNSLSSTVESRKNRSIIEATRPIPEESASLLEKLKWVCWRMDPALLVKFLLVKRREASTLRLEMTEALSECIDPERFVIEAVRDFVEMKREKRVGMTDTRWACSMAVGSMFPPEELKEGKVGSGALGRRVFSKKAVVRAEEVLREWKEVADSEGKESGGGGGCGMWHSEAAMFLGVVLGFGLKEMFDEELYKKLILQFCGRRVMAKLAVPIFGDGMSDLIEELVKEGKDIEAIYFAFESGLTDRFQPVSFLKTALRKSKKNCLEILKKGHNSSTATDEANSLEMIFIKYVIKCVEDHKIEEQFPIDSLRKRLTVLEKAKADKKGATVRYSKRMVGARHSVPPSSRPAKVLKCSNPYSSFPRRDHTSIARPAPASAYPGSYTYPSQPAYDASTYAPSYSGPHIPTPAHSGQITQQYYGNPGDSALSTGATLGSSYGSEVGYVSYDYGTTAAPAYQAPTYPQ